MGIRKISQNVSNEIYRTGLSDSNTVNRIELNLKIEGGKLI